MFDGNYDHPFDLSDSAINKYEAKYHAVIYNDQIDQEEEFYQPFFDSDPDNNFLLNFFPVVSSNSNSPFPF